MKKQKQLMGYQALPNRSVSPPVNQQNWMTRRGSGPLPEQQQPLQQAVAAAAAQPVQRRPQRAGITKPIAPGQVGHAMAGPCTTAVSC